MRPHEKYDLLFSFKLGKKKTIQFNLLLVFTIHNYHYNDKILSFYKENIVSGETVMMEVLYFIGNHLQIIRSN